MLEFKITDEGSRVDVYDGPIMVASIYAHEKHIAVISKYLDKAKPNEKVLANLVTTDLNMVPGVEIEFLI